MENKQKKETIYQRENRIRQYWLDNNTFENSINTRSEKPSFVFYEGPPTANGLPHVGHALGRTIKDVVARYKTMTGHRVVRKAGWDTHGLPVELGVEKELGISGKNEIEDYGIEEFIQKCKESVFVYEKQWRDFTEQLGYWVDMDDAYMTLSNPYIESVWNILGTIHEKGLLTKGHRVSPYCPSCQTSLSSHEVAQGYKTVKDLSATVKFKLKDNENESFLVWTTTPWTLPSNVALAVNPNMRYVRAKKEEEVFIVAEALAETILEENFEILSVHSGSEFTDISYIPPFDYAKVEVGHVVVEADYVTEESGTGIVHLAPAYGEEDYRVVQENGLSFINVVNEKGQYTKEIPSLQGRFVKDCDVDIIRHLSGKKLLFKKEKYEHNYPHCWRCDSPLLYYANESWFIKTTAVKEQFIKNNDSVIWHPEHVKHGRFGNFLDQMVDWNISRKRYWGTPLNVWQCEICQNEYAPKSIAELKYHSITSLEEDIELHKPYVDQISLQCKNCNGEMKRTPEVIDVWFDSGSMPFAQYHYPFENNQIFEDQFPADVVIEGIDQTRGWFYSLQAVSTLFAEKPAYKRVLALGHILDENGQKMSKSKGNALDPSDLIMKYGADSLRWALLVDSAPWNPKRFSERIVQEAKSKLVDTLDNVYSFYSLYAELDGFDINRDYQVKTNKLDEWILSRLHSTIKIACYNLEEYHFTNAAREIARLLEEVSNWYVRRSRDRFWASGMTEEKAAAYQTLHEVLKGISKMLAPLTPYIAEDIYKRLTSNSVHLSEYPKYNANKINEYLENEMNAVLQVVELGRNIRNSTSLKVKQPLASISILNAQDTIDWDNYKEIIMDELNVKKFFIVNDEDQFASTKIKLDFKKAGSKIGKNSNIVNKWLQNLGDKEIQNFLKTGFIEFNTSNNNILQISSEDVVVDKVSKEGFASATNGSFTVTLDTILSDDLIKEGKARELIRAIQDYRKHLNLPINMRVDVLIKADSELENVINTFRTMLTDNLLMRDLKINDHVKEAKEIKVGSHKVLIQLVPVT